MEASGLAALEPTGLEQDVRGGEGRMPAQVDLDQRCEPA